eukprot:CAMPEP_0176060504 /NCGR_PEP_ID=MMETSP0120_2-20121206/30158_1 /TAXON_ID=160619 /ORGANISM="Kryptoperidinium foliaceum, Strain CCMP 1326" /LENGTH=384 /DNA_ID=CAMNT_0017394049 /DNA_START=32 /DNA_END=1186 /DNA_ORIENTATION=+
MLVAAQLCHGQRMPCVALVIAFTACLLPARASRSLLLSGAGREHARAEHFGSSHEDELCGHGRFILSGRDGVPDLDVLYTGHIMEAVSFVEAVWAEEYAMGLDMEWRPWGSPNPGALLQISAQNKVLILDLVALRGWRPEAFPPAFMHFMESRTFYGMGVVQDAARLAFEFDCVVRAVDFNAGAWRLPKGRGGLAGLAFRTIGCCGVSSDKRITLSDWEERPLRLAQLRYAAEDAYLSWRVALHFLRRDGWPSEASFVSMVQMYSVAVREQFIHIRVPWPRYDWSQAAIESKAIEAEQAARKTAARRRSRARRAARKTVANSATAQAERLRWQGADGHGAVAMRQDAAEHLQAKSTGRVMGHVGHVEHGFRGVTALVYNAHAGG